MAPSSHAQGAAAPGGTLHIESSTTSVPLGKATLNVGPLQRGPGKYSGNFEVQVRPLSFAGEKGTLAVDFSDDDLHKLGQKTTVSFHGEATNEGGKKRSIDGRATPTAADHGNIVIKINSEKGKLVFNTTYRFSGN